MADYSFLSIWELRAPIEEVWGLISQPISYPEWFSYVVESDQVTEGDESGVGTVTRTHWTSALPYSLVFLTRTTRSERPHLIEVTSSGDLEGSGRWELAADGDRTTVRYEWNVRTTKRWMDLLAPLARPAFGWNHAVIMRSGGEGLAARLGAELVRNQSFTAESASPLVPLTTTIGLLTVTILCANWLRRALSRS